MAIQFTLHTTPKPNGREGEVSTHARALCKGTYKLDKICKLISMRSTISSADVKGVLDSLAWVMEMALEEGYHIELEELGYFAPSLRTRAADDNKSTVEVDGINYRCSVNLRDKLKRMELKQVKEKKSSDKPEEQEAKMLAYAREWNGISPRMYAQQFDCSRYQAEKELQEYVEKGVLQKVGYRNKIMYLPIG